MSLSTQAEIDAFLAGDGPVTITYLDANGFTVAGTSEDVSMVRLRRPKGQGLISVRLDAAEAAPILQRLYAKVDGRRRAHTFAGVAT